MIIVSVTGPSLADAERQIRGSRPHADLFELRLDLIRPQRLSHIVPLVSRPFIATCRPTWEGGAFTGAEEKRLRILEAACEAGAAFVDIEFRAGEGARRRLRQAPGHHRLIVSLHLPRAKSPDPAAMFDALASSNGEVLKFAFAARDAYENALAFEFLMHARRHRQNAVAIAMGEAGEASRVLYRKFGGWGTYAGTEDGKTAAPGQIPASELRRIYRADRLTSSTRVFGVVGNPLGQSKGVYVHNALFRKEGLNAVYCKFLVSDLGRFMISMAPHLRGFSVTIPHKQEVMRYLDRVDTTARAIGAVNTVVRRNGKLIGTNTDAPAALDAIERKMPVKGKTMMIIGAGGAARAIAFEAKRRGAKVQIANRTAAKARRLASELGLAAVPLEDAGHSDILVNATSVGMTPRAAESPLPARMIRARVVFDVVYNPAITRLLTEARKRKAAVVSGLEMYVNQGARQSRLFTGRAPQVALMRRILRDRLGRPKQR